jgi:hypothetical protein
VEHSRTLPGVATAQLVCGCAGLAIALRRRYPYEFLWLRGRPEHVSRDWLTMGTALSAPAPMLVGQALLTRILWKRPSVRVTQGLRLLGATMVIGYLGERHVRHRLSAAGWDPFESPLTVAAIALAAAMAQCGRRS